MRREGPFVKGRSGIGVWPSASQSVSSRGAIGDWKMRTGESETTSILGHDLQVGDDAVAIAPKADGAAGAVAEFVHHQRWLCSAVDEDVYLRFSTTTLA